MYHGFHNNINRQLFSTFLQQQQLSILQWLLNDHVTVKTSVMGVSAPFFTF